MAGAAQLIARLQARPVPSVPSPKNMMEPLEPAPAVAVPSVPWVPSRKHQTQGANRENRPAQLAPTERPQFIRTAATASPAWLAARDQYLNHVMTCRACYAPAGRHCPAGADLRASYDRTPLELTT